MKATQALLALIAGVATYKIFSTFRYTIPEQQPPDKITGESVAAKLASDKPSAHLQESGPDVGGTVGPIVGCGVDCPCEVCLDAVVVAVLPPLNIFNELSLAVGERSSDDIPKFNLIRKTSQDVLLRNFASDYTSPRMTSDDDLYEACVNAANFSGAPCGWVQYVAQECTDYEQLHLASDAMLSYFDSNIDGCESLKSLRSDTIAIGMLAAKGPGEKCHPAKIL